MRLKEIQSILETFAFVGDHPGKVVFQSLLIADALADLARSDDPLTTKSDEAQKILQMIANSELKDKDVGLVHLVNGITLFKSNIKQAQKALLKVRVCIETPLGMQGFLCCYFTGFFSRNKRKCSFYQAHNARFPVPISRFPGMIARRLLVKVLSGKRDKEKNTLEALKASAIKDDDKEFLKIYDQVIPPF